MRVEGKESVVTFDGGTLTLLRPDGSRLVLPAVSGEVDALGRTQPELQALRDVGPIPEGAYSFRPGDIQEIKFLDNLLGTFSLGRLCAWPGGTIAWGRQRVFLDPGPETETFGRSGFAIHGGARLRVFLYREGESTRCRVAAKPSLVDDLPMRVEAGLFLLAILPVAGSLLGCDPGFAVDPVEWQPRVQDLNRVLRCVENLGLWRNTGGSRTPSRTPA